MRKCKYPEIQVGDEYGQLTVLAPAPKLVYRDGHEYWAWLCQCQCGKQIVMRDATLKGGAGTHKGCWTPEAKQAARERAQQHGEGANGKESSEYVSWCSLNKRSRNAKLKERFPSYASVQVCEGWRSYEIFLADMGRKPTPKHSIDRRDNNGNYTCGHCTECLRYRWPMNGRWATALEQAHNRRPRSSVVTV